MKKKELRQKIVKALAEKMPDGKFLKKQKPPSEIKSEAIPLDKAEKIEALNDELRDMVRSVITTVRPYVDAARIQRMFYEQMPSIMTGSRMQEVVAQAQAKYENAIVILHGKWEDYEDRISKEDYNEIIDDELRKQTEDFDKILYR